MKAGYTHIAALLDRSGSMSSIISDMRGGFINYIDEQKKLPGSLTITVAQFDSDYEMLVNNLAVEPSTHIDLSKYIPRGMTALRDSFCRLIDETGAHLASLDESERPEKVLFICITDGQENASRERSADDLRKRIETQEKKFNWSFVFLGANQDSFATGGAIGVRGGATQNFVANSAGVQNLYASLTASTASYRSAAPDSMFMFEPESKESLSQ